MYLNRKILFLSLLVLSIGWCSNKIYEIIDYSNHGVEPKQSTSIPQRFQILENYTNTNSRDEYIDFTPNGPLVEGNSPLWGNKGYQFTVEQTFTMYAGEWWINLPSDGYVRASIYDANGDLLVMGETVFSDSNEEKWYRSALEFTFEQDETYTLSFYCNQSYEAIFDFIDFDDDLQPFNVGDMLTDVWSRSSSSDTEEEFPDYLGNSWAPFQRMVTLIQDEIEGCTDSEALNYDADATIDGDCCVYYEDIPIEGLADLNNDSTINIQDIIVMVNIILSTVR